MLEILLNGIMTGVISFVVFMSIFGFAAWRIRKQNEKENR
jgi:preprotein translocase subunit YajC